MTSRLPSPEKMWQFLRTMSCRQDGFYPSDKLLYCHSETCLSTHGFTGSIDFNINFRTTCLAGRNDEIGMVLVSHGITQSIYEIQFSIFRFCFEAESSNFHLRVSVHSPDSGKLCSRGRLQRGR